MKLRAIRHFIAKSILVFIPDVIYIRFLYFFKTREILRLSNPKNYNQWLQWLKLNDRNEVYTELVDKYLVRNHIENSIGKQYLIPLIGVYANFDDIDFESLPEKFVLKCTHGSGMNFICTSKKTVDIKRLRSTVSSWMKLNYYTLGREWVYKNCEPRIIIEQYMEDESEQELKDYKIYCFNGEPEFIQLDFARFSNHKRNLYDLDWNLLDQKIDHKNDKDVYIQQPDNFKEMLKIARTLSEGMFHCRVDLYSIYDKIYFGELTFYSEAGYGKFSSDEFNVYLGDKIKRGVQE